MMTNDIAAYLTTLFSELVNGASRPGASFMLNSGDAGLLRSLEKLSAAEASNSMHGGATIAAHTRHLQYDLSLMNGWARHGGDPFADARSEEAWKTSSVSEDEWREIREALSTDARVWLDVLRTPRDATSSEISGMIGSIVHLAYHFGAMRQIASTARGPKDET
jgi:hypothetical protein